MPIHPQALAGYDGVAPAVPSGLLGVISYHGGVAASRRLAAANATGRPKLMVHSGTKDDSHADISTLMDELEGVGASFQVSRYGSGVVHCFTEWDSALPGQCQYDRNADVRSWQASTSFFAEVFGTGALGSAKPKSCPAYNSSLARTVSTTPGVVQPLTGAAHTTGPGVPCLVLSMLVAATWALAGP